MYLLCKKKSRDVGRLEQNDITKIGISRWNRSSGYNVPWSPTVHIHIFAFLFAFEIFIIFWCRSAPESKEKLFHSSPCDVFTQLTKIWKLSRIFIRCLLRRVLFLKENAQNIVNRRNMESTSRSGDQMWWMSIDGISWKGVGFVILRYVDLKRQCLPGGWW